MEEFADFEMRFYFGGLAVLADSYPEKILERLLQGFQRSPSLPTSNTERSVETRLKVGEVLMRASRAMGEYRLKVRLPILCRVKSSKYSLYVYARVHVRQTPAVIRRPLSVPTGRQADGHTELPPGTAGSICWHHLRKKYNFKGNLWAS